ncbi:unnamed protein product [Caenorhabditis nigoni]
MGWNLQQRHHNLNSLRVGVLAVAIFGTIEYAAFHVMYTDYWNAYPYFILSHWLVLVFFGLCIMEPSYKCKFPTRHEGVLAAIAVVALVYGYKRVIDSGVPQELWHLHYIMWIGLAYIDSYVLFTDTSEIIFFGSFTGKRVIVKTYSKIDLSIKDEELMPPREARKITVIGTFTNLDKRNNPVLTNAKIYKSGSFYAFEPTRTISEYDSIEEVDDKTESLIENSCKLSTGNKQGMPVAL